MRQQQRLAADSGCGKRRLGAGMTATNDHNIEFFGVEHIALLRARNHTGKETVLSPRLAMFHVKHRCIRSHHIEPNHADMFHVKH